eukprot:363308-Chlamydomonas_euryale.AAC.1
MDADGGVIGPGWVCMDAWMDAWSEELIRAGGQSAHHCPANKSRACVLDYAWQMAWQESMHSRVLLLEGTRGGAWTRRG